MIDMVLKLHSIVMVVLIGTGTLIAGKDSLRITVDSVRVLVEPARAGDSARVVYKGETFEIYRSLLSAQGESIIVVWTKDRRRLQVPVTCVELIGDRNDAARSATDRSSNVVPSGTSSTSTQCMGTTKSGRRCSRMTTNASGRCWQHE